MGMMMKRIRSAFSIIYQKKGKQMTLNDLLTGDTTMRYIQDVGRAMYSGHLSNSTLNHKMLNGTPLSHITDVHEYTLMEGESQKVKKRLKTQFPKQATEHLRKKIFGKGFEFEVQTAEESVQEEIREYLEDVFDHNDFKRNLADLTEDAFNLGGMVIKPTVRDSKLELDFIKAEKFWHTQYNNKMVYGGVFITTWQEDEHYYTKLTWYEKLEGTDNWEINKQLFESKRNGFLGEEINFKNKFPDEDEYILLKDYSSIPFTYWKPNVKNNIVPESPLGIPIWINGIDKIKFLDTTFHRYYQEIDYGGIKRTLPSWAFDEVVDDTGRPKTRYNKEDETLMILESPPEMKDAIKDLTPELRIQQFSATMKDALDLASQQFGISPGSFKWTGSKIEETATSSKIKAYDTHETKLNHEETLITALRNLFKSIIEMSYAEDLFGILPDDLDFEINFVDEMFKDEEEEIKRYREDAMAGNIPLWRYILKAYPDEVKTVEEAKAWVEEASQEDMLSALEGIEDAEAQEEDN